MNNCGVIRLHTDPSPAATSVVAGIVCDPVSFLLVYTGLVGREQRLVG